MTASVNVNSNLVLQHKTARPASGCDSNIKGLARLYAAVQG